MNDVHAKQSKKVYIALLAIICLQLVSFILTFAVQKQSFHEDEFFSYALANSSGRPFLYGSHVQVADNFNA